MGAFIQTGTRFSATAEARDFDRVVAILADGEAHPTFEEPWLSVERSQLANSLQSESQISGVMIDRAYDRLCSCERRSDAAPADRAERSAITREDLLAYARRYWRPDLTTISIVGDLSPERVRSALEASFGSWQAAGPKPDANLMAMPPASSGHDYIGTSANQVYIRLGQPALSRSSQDYDTLASAQSNPGRAPAHLNPGSGKSCGKSADSSTASTARSRPVPIVAICASSSTLRRSGSSKPSHRAPRAASPAERTGFGHRAARSEGSADRQRAVGRGFDHGAGPTAAGYRWSIVCRPNTMARSTNVSRGSPPPTSNAWRARIYAPKVWSKFMPGLRARGRCTRYDRERQPGQPGK